MKELAKLSEFVFITMWILIGLSVYVIYQLGIRPIIIARQNRVEVAKDFDEQQFPYSQSQEQPAPPPHHRHGQW